jgi:hypothetical protein
MRVSVRHCFANALSVTARLWPGNYLMLVKRRPGGSQKTTSPNIRTPFRIRILFFSNHREMRALMSASAASPMRSEGCLPQ